MFEQISQSALRPSPRTTKARFMVKANVTYSSCIRSAAVISLIEMVFYDRDLIRPMIVSSSYIHLPLSCSNSVPVIYLILSPVASRAFRLSCKWLCDQKKKWQPCVANVKTKRNIRAGFLPAQSKFLSNYNRLEPDSHRSTPEIPWNCEWVKIAHKRAAVSGSRHA